MISWNNRTVLSDDGIEASQGWHFRKIATFAHMKQFTIFVWLLVAALSAGAQEPDNLILEELPAKPAQPARQAPPGYAYNSICI